MGKVLVRIGIGCLVFCSGCAVKWQVNPVTWTDERDGYDIGAIRGAVKGPGEGPVIVDPRRRQGAVLEQSRYDSGAEHLGAGWRGGGW